MVQDFSVLMSVYIGESASNIEECFESLLNQTISANEWVIVEDGPLKGEVYEVLDRFEREYEGLIKRIRLENNQGLGIALREGIAKCSNEIVARMDTDDIAVNNRFEKQLNEFKNNPKLDICGGFIDEFIDNPNEIVARRTVPITMNEIEKYQKRRDAFNHMTVMFKKSAVLKAGNYQPCPLMEDTYLWVRMIQTGAVCMNIPEPLVLARVGKEMFKRRGGLEYYKKYREGRSMVKDTGFIGTFDYCYTLLIQLIVSIMPNGIRGLIFKKVLHRK